MNEPAAGTRHTTTAASGAEQAPGAAVTSDGAGATDAAAAPPALSLRSLIVRGSLWTLGGNLTLHAMRLGASLITTRLLLREHFGLMALVAVCLHALEMFSDIGTHMNIVQSRRGDDRDFLNTAFTIEALRGAAMFLIVCILAWPMAAFYGEPMLLQLLPVAGLTALINGVTNTSLSTHSRHMALGRLMVLDVGAMVIQVSVMVGLALVWRSVWVLVIGGLAANLARLIVSHTVLRVHANRFRWDRESVRSLVHFGKWILVSSVLGFFINRGDVVVIGKLVPMAMLGVFHIASQFAYAIRQLHFKLGSSVLYPALVRLGEDPMPVLRGKIARLRLGVMALMLPPLWFFVVLGPEFMLIFPEEYHGGGLMLQILAAGVIFVVVPDVGPIYLARGNSFLFMITLAVRSALLLACMLAGAYAAPALLPELEAARMWGLIAGVSAAAALFYPVQVWVCRLYGVWLPLLDVAGFAASALVITAGLWAKALLLS